MSIPSVIRPDADRRSGRASYSSGPSNIAWRSHAEVLDLGSCYEVHMTIHGVVPDRLKVEVRDEVLVVVGRREAGPYSHSRDESDFQRIIGLPVDAARMGATARLESELLVIRIPKMRGGSGRTLDVECPDSTRGGE